MGVNKKNFQRVGDSELIVNENMTVDNSEVK